MNQVVIGASIDAMRWAFKHDTSVVHTGLRMPHRFTGQLDEYTHLVFCLSLAGKVKKVSQIRITDDGLRLTLPRSVKVLTNTEYVFFDEEVVGMPANEAQQTYEVLDWISVRSGMKHPHDIIRPAKDKNFVSHIYFYPSERISGNHDLKDACAVSYLSEEQLTLLEYSELMSRFETELLMLEHGIEGSGNGTGRTLPLKLESSHREVFPLLSNRHRELPENFVWSEEFIDKYPRSSNNYLNYLMSGVKGD